MRLTALPPIAALVSPPAIRIAIAFAATLSAMAAMPQIRERINLAASRPRELRS